MKAIAKLKDEARKHEQREEWEKAIQAYTQLLEIGEQGDAYLDLPLYNRVGDLYVRLGRSRDAVTHYAKAADRYGEAGLFNNAIALCNKALRYDANRLDLFRKLGSFSAQQGFFTDARRWYLEYAEKMTKRGHLDEALSALSEYADIADDADIRELIARELKQHGREEQAVEEFKRAYALRVNAGQHEAAEALLAEIHAINPDADVSAVAKPAVKHTHTHQQLPGFLESDRAAAAPQPLAEPATEPEPPSDELVVEATAIGEAVVEAPEAYEPLEGVESGFVGAGDTETMAPLDIEMETPLGLEAKDLEGTGLELPYLEKQEAAEAEEEPFELPRLDDFHFVEAEGEIAAEPLPMFGEEQAGEAAFEFAEPEPKPEVSYEPEAEPGPEAEPEAEFAEEGAVESVAEPELQAEWQSAPEVASEAERHLAWEEPELEAETAVEIREPEAEIPPAIEQPPEPPVEAAAPPPPPAPAPAKPKRDYVDLATFLMDDEEEVGEDTTRFIVAEQAPTGDEDRDFAEMLEQFKSKVAESIPKEDAGSHYDLGIAFKEMGLIDEAIGEFQTALRAGQEKLKVYEELGSCFLQKGQYTIAITVLNRAQQMPYKDEQELLGVYYSLGRAHEELGQRAEAKAAYERILAIDIGFQDATARVAKL